MNRNQMQFWTSEGKAPFPARSWYMVVFLILILNSSVQSGSSAEYQCYNLKPSSLPARTLWIRIETGTAPYEITGNYRIQLNANGTYTVPPENGVSARSGVWSSTNTEPPLVIRLKGFMNDSVEDVLTLFSGCQNGAACTSCGYAMTREGTPGLQAGTYTLTDGEAPSPSGAPNVSVLSGGGGYPAGSSIFLFPQVPGNPSSYKAKWFRNDVLIQGATTVFQFINNAQPEQSGVYRVEISNAAGTTKVSTRVTIRPVSEAPQLLGRTWKKLADDATLLPGTTYPLGTPGMRGMSIRNGRVTLQAAQGRGLLRWKAAQKETILSADDPLPGSLKLTAVIEFAEDDDGVIDVYARHNLGYGLFELQGTNALQITGVGSSVPGSPTTTFTGFLGMARKGGRLIYSASTSANKTGVFMWDGKSSTPLLAPGEDLPGLLGPIQQVLSLKFDGETIVMQANDSVQFQGNNRQGIYSRTLSTPWKEVTNATQPPPNLPSSLFKIFNGVDVSQGTLFFSAGPIEGHQLFAADPSRPPRFVGPSFSADLVTAQFSASNPLNVYLRNAGNLSLLGNGLSERVVGANDFLDGKQINDVLDVATDNLDVVIHVQFVDGSHAIYGAIGAAEANAPLQLSAPVFSQGQWRFTIPTRAGTAYQVEHLSSLNADDWEPRQTVAGDGTVKTIDIDTSGARGFYRVVEVIAE